MPTSEGQSKLTHLDDQGRARMVDVSEKQTVQRRAMARGCVRMRPETRSAIIQSSIAKGDVLQVARIAGIGAAKQTWSLIPLCHQIALASVAIEFCWLEEQNSSEGTLEIVATVAATERTGVEMEALMAVTVAGLTVYDMCKSIDRSMQLTSVEVIEKQGGRSGHFRRNERETNA